MWSNHGCKHDDESQGQPGEGHRTTVAPPGRAAEAMGACPRGVTDRHESSAVLEESGKLDHAVGGCERARRA